MKELFAKLMEHTCIVQGREAISQQIIEEYLIAYGEHVAATQVQPVEVAEVVTVPEVEKPQE